MKSPEISIREIFQAYRSYWWVVVVVFLVGSLIGFLLTVLLPVDVTITEFSLPVVILEQTSTNWKEEDTFAMIGFVKAWFDHRWEWLVKDRYPAAEASVVLRKDTYFFIMEENGKISDPETIHQLAEELFTAFQNEFMDNSGNSMIIKVANQACLTDAAQQALVVCTPMINGMENSLGEGSFDLSAFLWIGEVSEVQTIPKVPYIRYLQMIAAGLCAEMSLVIYMLVDLTRKYAKVA